MIRATIVLVSALVSATAADVVWIDDFDDLGSPGTDQTWFDPWPSWTSEGIAYFLGTTDTSTGDSYHCGAACEAPADSSEYSHFGRFMAPSTGGVDLVAMSTGIAFGSSSSYTGWADFAQDMVWLTDQTEGVGSQMAGSAPFVLEDDTWYRYRLEQDLSELVSWIRVKIWAEGQPEPVYWTVEGSGIGHHPGQHILIHGFDAVPSGIVHFDDVGVESQIAPRRINDLASAHAGDDLVLNWTVGVTADFTSAYQGVDDPCFTPLPGSEVSGLTGGSLTVPGILGDPGTHHFFLVRGVNESGEGPPSNRVGEFEFEMLIPPGPR